MNVLITGAFGFVGTNLSMALKTTYKHHLIAIDIRESDNHIFDDYYSWDDLENVDWKKIDAIIHLAGKAHDTRNATNLNTYFDINVGLTKQIFEFFLNSNAEKFIFFSSVKAVADSVNGDFLADDVEPNPGTAYGLSKLQAENWIMLRLRDWSTEQVRLGKIEYERANSKKVYILRPCMIHGQGNKGNLNLLYRMVGKGIPWPLGAFENERSFTSIRNLQFIIQNIIENAIEPGTYLISDDKPISTNQIIKLIASSQGKKARIWKINKRLIKYIVAVGDIFHLPLNSERLAKLTESYVVSNDKLKHALGIKNMPVSSLEGMGETLLSFKVKNVTKTSNNAV